jgi:predicted nucleotidyltransferase
VSLPGTVELLGAMLRATARASLRWYVFGAQAVAVYGRPRLTADVDVTIDPAGKPNVELLELLALEGIVPRNVGFDGFLTTSRLMPLVHAATSVPVDVVLAADGLEQDFLSRALPVDIGGVVVPVLRVEDLIATKMLANRRKDREDVLGILEERRDKIEVELVRSVLRDLDAALDEPRALAAFERLFKARARKSTRPPAKK